MESSSPAHEPESIELLPCLFSALSGSSWPAVAALSLALDDEWWLLSVLLFDEGTDNWSRRGLSELLLKFLKVLRMVAPKPLEGDKIAK